MNLKHIYNHLRYILSNFYNKKIVDEYFYIFNYQFHIRCLPQKYLNELNIISKTIDNDEYVKGKLFIEEAINYWGQDPDLVRLNTYIDFMKG